MSSIEKLLSQSKKQMMREFGMQPPPIATHKVVPELMIASWACLRESLVIGDAPRYKKEVLAAAVSQKNECPYCVEAHNMMAKSLAPSEVSESTDLENGRIANELEPIHSWVKDIDMGNLRELAPIPQEFEPKDEYLATLTIFHYLNRFVSAYHENNFLPKFMKAPAKWMMPVASKMMKSLDGKEKARGQSIVLGTDDSEISFTDRQAIQDAYRQMHKVVNDLATQHFCSEFIDHFNQQISSFYLKPIGNFEKQIQEVIDHVPVKEGIEADLLPLMVRTAFSPKTIDKVTISQLEKTYGKAEVMIAISWAAFMTSLYIVNEIARHLNEPLKASTQ